MNNDQKIKNFWNVDNIDKAMYERVGTIKSKNSKNSAFSEDAVLAIIDKIILKHNKNIKNFNILDFGCGVGRILKFFSKNNTANFYGTDISENMLSYCKEYCSNDKIILKLSKTNKINFEDNFFDIIYSFHVLQHIPTLENLTLILNEINRIQKKNGISILHFNKKTSETNKAPGSFEGYRPSYDNCIKLLKLSNFDIIDTEYVENGSFVIYLRK